MIKPIVEIELHTYTRPLSPAFEVDETEEGYLHVDIDEYKTLYLVYEQACIDGEGDGVEWLSKYLEDLSNPSNEELSYLELVHGNKVVEAIQQLLEYYKNGCWSRVI